MPEYTIVTYTRRRFVDEEEALRYATCEYLYADRVVVKHGSVALRARRRGDPVGVVQVAMGRAAREVRGRLAGAS